MPGINSRDVTPLDLTPLAIIASMQVRALALLPGRQSLSPKLVIDLAVGLPALFDGSVSSIVAFRSIDEAGFRRAILVLLLGSGASLVLA
jgi:uncharacterized protein